MVGSSSTVCGGLLDETRFFAVGIWCTSSSSASLLLMLCVDCAYVADFSSSCVLMLGWGDESLFDDELEPDDPP